jgi:hypothetical protein
MGIVLLYMADNNHIHSQKTNNAYSNTFSFIIFIDVLMRCVFFWGWGGGGG